MYLCLVCPGGVVSSLVEMLICAAGLGSKMLYSGWFQFSICSNCNECTYARALLVGYYFFIFVFVFYRGGESTHLLFFTSKEYSIHISNHLLFNCF